MSKVNNTSLQRLQNAQNHPEYYLGYRIIDQTEDHTVNGKQSHLLKHVLAQNHQHVV